MNVVVSNASPKLGRLTLVSFVETKLTVTRAVGISGGSRGDLGVRANPPFDPC